MKNSIPEPQFLSVPEAARLCGVSRNTLYTWVRKGKLGAYQTPGRTNLIRPSDLVKFMEGSGMFVPAALMDMAQRDDANHSTAPAAATTSQANVAILVVDDDSISRSVMVRALNRNYRIIQAQTGYEALHLLTIHEDIQAVLLDLRMPGQHGLSTLREIKLLRPTVPVIIVTGFANEVPEEMLRKGTVARVVEKPVTVPGLLAVVEEVLVDQPTVSE